MLRPDSGRTRGEGHLPNLRIVTRDPAHASRRLLSRTWKRDPYIIHLVGALLWNKNSLAKTMRYTRVFRDLFLDHQEERRTDPAQRIIKNLAFAKQRFDSLALPLARLVQHFDCALDVVADILQERPPASPEHKNAAQLVDIMDSEAMLQMGMLADCAEACLDLTRCVDKETFDIGLVPGRLDQFKDVCEFMCARCGCMTHPGHNTRMLHLIQQPRLLRTGACRPKTIGDICGISAAAAATCLARMQNWWALAQAVLSTEFPEFDIAWCFAAFDIARVEGGVPANLKPACASR